MRAALDLPVVWQHGPRLILRRLGVPTNSAIFPATLEEARSWPTGTMDLTFCANCALLFNASHDDQLIEYTARNVETQAFSEHFVSFAHELAADWIERFRLTGAHVIEVGPGRDAPFCGSSAS